VSFPLVVGDAWATTVEALLGTHGELEARVPDENGAGFTADVSWPAAYPIAYTEEGFVEVAMTLGASGIAFAAAKAAP
jgi:hypothetical protein